MNLLARIAGALHPAAAPGARCGQCRHFADEPFHRERATPGYAVLSSALGAVHAGDGHCERHARFTAARAGCADFSPRVVPGRAVQPASKESGHPELRVRP